MPPTRTCIACRRSATPDALLRLVPGADGAVQLDLRRRHPGRGAWIHPHRDCFDKLRRRPKGLARALRSEIRVAGLEDRVLQACLEQLRVLLATAACSGCVVGGRAANQRQAARGELSAVVFASDASARSIAHLQWVAPGIPFFRLALDRRALGQCVGKGPRAALGLRRGAPVRPLLDELRRYASLGYHPPRNRSGDRAEATRVPEASQPRGRGPHSQSSTDEF